MKNYISAAYSKMCRALGRKSRKSWRRKLERSKLKNSDFTIFSQNCIGGMMYHDLGLQFKSPTVNLLFAPSDFIRFMNDIKAYLDAPLQFVCGEEKHPAAMIRDVRIDFVHYKTAEEAEQKWEERKLRINWDNVFVICCDENLSYEEIVAFDNLPYDNKIIFLSKKMPEIKSGIYAKRFSDKTDARLLNFTNPFGRRHHQDYFDYIKWLNKESDFIKMKGE